MLRGRNDFLSTPGQEHQEDTTRDHRITFITFVHQKLEEPQRKFQLIEDNQTVEKNPRNAMMWICCLPMGAWKR